MPRESSSDESSDNETANVTAAAAAAAAAAVSNDKRTRVTSNSCDSRQTFDGNHPIIVILVITGSSVFSLCMELI